MSAMLRKGFAAFILLLVALPVQALAEPDFPKLTGRVVDNAALLSSAERAALTEKLRAHEKAKSNQLVVATVPSLQGYAIEDFANRLFRHWKLGQKEHDNGVLLLVAPNERKVRIEVGYGLEGLLTDATSKIIIQRKIVPAFKKAAYAQGINDATAAILDVLSGTPPEWIKDRKSSKWKDNEFPMFVIFVIGIFVLGIFRTLGRRHSGVLLDHGHRPRHRHFGGGFSSGGGFGGGGFSGGGGSSGGGGASGGW